MSYRLGTIDIHEASFDRYFSDDALANELLYVMSNQQNPCVLSNQQNSCAWDAYVFDTPPAQPSMENYINKPQSSMLPQQELPSSFDTIGNGMSSPEVISKTSLTPELVDLKLDDTSQWSMPYSKVDQGIIPLVLSYDAADDGLQTWQEAAHVPQGLEIPDAASDAVQIMNCAIMPDDIEQQRAREFWFETDTDSSEPMFKPIIPPYTPSVSGDSLFIVSPAELSSETTGSPTTTIFTEETSESADEQDPSPENVAVEQKGGRRKLPDVSSEASLSTDDSSFFIMSREKTLKLAIRRRQKRRASPLSDTSTFEGPKSPPFRKIDQMDPLSRQLLDEILLNDRRPPIGKPIPYSVIMVRLRHLYCGAEETLRGHFRRLTKPKDQRVRKPVWTPNDVSLLEEAVKIYLDANTKRKISWTAVGDYIFSHGGSYRFGVTACSKKWYSLSK